MGVVAPSRNTRYPAIPAPASVDAVQVMANDVVDWAAAVTPSGMLGAGVSAAGGGGGGGAGAWSAPPPPAPRSRAAAVATRTAAKRADATRMRETSERPPLEGW